MLTLTTIVLTVLTLGVQLAMQQFSPRIVRALLGDRASQLSHGLFAGTFLFCMIAVAQVDDTAEPGQQVPSVTVASGYVLLFASLIVLVAYVHHAGQSLRVAGLIDVVGDNLQSEIDRSFPARTTPRVEAGVVTADESGVVVMLDHPLLIDQARRSEDRLEMLVAVGDFVPRGAPVVRGGGGRGGGGGGALDARAIRRGIVLDNERSHVGDAAYGLRKLVDIAERSIASSPYQDPATAVQSIDRLHDAMRQLCVRPLSESMHRDAAGTVRLITRELSWDGYVAVAFDELVDLGSSSPLVARRLLAALDDLVETAPPERRAALEERRTRLRDAAAGEGRRLHPDVQGLGSGPDLLAREGSDGPT
ncbi:hypothetical protein GCM10010988_25610 [Cnuibacter physcomitrellae]|uniref:Uncharacterized protein n=1 Tax=Cnuibacter physcomitrellae TaxID=1619308 RepID=A0A1X9LFH5_9MICO|nr:DUF2254 family protein [Cnuibacter physcomitrellae]ARJ03893.1 hypothetical protein B5808_00565 [Cnuibacter physcomitrellae]GGI39746.1 hypothetical protein GCM10010988_25610 [Cnuibacter physcomitrellae]